MHLISCTQFEIKKIAFKIKIEVIWHNFLVKKILLVPIKSKS